MHSYVTTADTLERGDGSEVARQNPTQFCTSSYGRFCGTSGDADRQRFLRHKQIVAEIEDAAARAAAVLLGLGPMDGAALRAFAVGQPRWRRASIANLVGKLRVHEVLRRVEPLRSLAEAEHARLRTIALVGLGREPATADRDAAVARLSASHLVWPEGEIGRYWSVPRLIQAGCGEDLLADEAFVDKRATGIVLCPGFVLVSGLREGEGPNEVRQRLAFLLAHELGHVVIGPGPETSSAEGERHADRWAAEILASDLARITDSGVREAYLRRALEPLCYSEPDPVHGSGRDRIDGTVMRQPAIEAALGCAPASAGT